MTKQIYNGERPLMGINVRKDWLLLICLDQKLNGEQVRRHKDVIRVEARQRSQLQRVVGRREVALEVF